jgi:ADP-ribose pyrophosphatase
MAEDGDNIRAPKISPWHELYANERYRVFQVEVDFGDFVKTYFPVHHGARIGVVVPWKGGILLVRQWRLLIEGFSLELPGGKVDEGETPEVAAARECLEETGLMCGRLERLVHYLPGMDNVLNHTYVLLAHNVEDNGTFTEERSEVVERLHFPLAECLARIDRGEIICGMTIAGLLTYARRQGAG